MTTPVLHPVTPTESVLRAFSRGYDARGTASYLDQIHCWAQRVRVPAVRWNIEKTGDQYYAIPEFPDVNGREYSHCRGQGPTQDIARQTATQHLQYLISNAHTEQVRWRFGQMVSRAGPVHFATPVVYDPPSFLVRDEVIGQGSTHQAAREDSARKLLELGYCRI
ncbi:hypothetical protein RSOLAG1IB_03100 [Rhizoctonia solani AG-1 IB]|uniref:Uncharacterized protein n=1 Tax=Thanatephorus cucumeris (strain AG1-IB / isolate 7/3/14) TaxID=1108050 RepID=A0A0B7FN42_THACB|nr:hypothetical protein RSOLAG1IB_03100 [Rhizoctonia solani AG-1 IB]